MESSYKKPTAPSGTRSDIRLLTVSGEGMIQAAPDEAVITLGAITENKDSKEAQLANSQTISSIIGGLSALGIPRNQMKTSVYRMDPQYNYVDGQEIFQNYRVQHMLLIELQDLESVGMTVDTAVKNGANTVSNVRFTLSNPEAVYNQALSLALRNAGEKAAALSQTLHINLHPVPVRIEEIPPASPPVLHQASTFTKAAPVPIQPGELTIRASVQADYTY
ncbi:SIMPL domain-containing protein [Bacillus massiliglaciei]|uniref:SIMPL domain-containing protein n=1 Tax=Bacillus massiliglaciei TaxID=1816693 RepID=UPI000DA6382A|nr:SIMPL domain-containing protein [Bacillus massiliglaciei]